MGMILFRLIGFFFVSMAFFSFGAVAGSRSKTMAHGRAQFPNLLDLAIISLSWMAAFFAYLAGYRTVVATAIGAGIGLFAAFTLYHWLKQSPGQESGIGTSGHRVPLPGIEPSAPAPPQSDDHFQPRWRAFVREVGGFQSRLLLTAFYFIAIMPFGIVVGSFGDPLGLKVPPGESFWKRRLGDSQNLEGARRQS
jgi:hypothetical protein